MSIPFKPLKTVQFTDEHNIESFDCGDPARNGWLRKHGLSTQDATAYVTLDAQNRVVAFHALAFGAITRTLLPSAEMRRNAPDPVGCIVLAQLAVTLGEQRKGVGKRMVVDAMMRASQINSIVHCRLLGVHPANDELLDFYVSAGFSHVETIPVMAVMSMKKVLGNLRGLGVIR